MQRIYVLSILLLIAIGIMKPIEDRLKTQDVSPAGIVSLELAFTQQKANAIKAAWEGNSAKEIFSNSPTHYTNKPLSTYAWYSIAWDIPFIIVYGLLLLAIDKHLYEGNPKRKRYRKWIIGACALDVLENAGMLLFLFVTPKMPALVFGIFAGVKFGILIVVVALFIWQTKILSVATQVGTDLIKLLSMLPLALLSLVVLFFAVWVSDQGQDMLLTINDHQFGPMTMYVVICVLAVMNWHFPKMFYNVSWKVRPFKHVFVDPFHYPPGTPINKIAIPRLLGLLSFLIPAFGILNILNVFEMEHLLSDFSPMLFMIIATAVIHYCFQFRKFESFKTHYPKSFVVTCALLALSPILLWPFNRSTAVDIQYLFIGLLCYGLLFSLITANKVSISNSSAFLKKLPITPIVWFGVSVPAVVFLYFVLCNFLCIQATSVIYMAFAVVISAVIFYYAAFALLNVAGVKNGVNFSLMVVVLLLINTSSSRLRFHYVQAEPTAIKAVELRTYIANWIRNRAQHVREGERYKVYLVNTHGGGIRASAWTCLTIAKLDSLQKVKDGELFQDHVLAYSGASGGTVGAALLCANKFAKSDTISLSKYHALFGKDFLTPILAGMLGSDILYPGFVASYDRAKVQDMIWETQYAYIFRNNYFSARLDSLWHSNYTVPLLFSNTTDFKNGCKGLYAPVHLRETDFPGATMVRNCMDANTSLKLSTASFMSARFPFLSPAAGVSEEHHFLDGGMIENSGAETSMQVYKVFREVLDTLDHKAYKDKFRIYMISLKNTFPKADSVQNKKSKNLSQLLAPVTGAVKVGITGNTNKAELINKHFFCIKGSDSTLGMYYLIAPNKHIVVATVENFLGKKTVESVQVPLPLGWSMSGLAMNRMQQCLENASREGGGLYKIVNDKD